MFVFTRNSAAVTALILVSGFGAGAPAFATASVSTLYVNNAQGSNCSDTGAGTQAQPYCTIQPAIDAASAGQTVYVSQGMYTGEVDITRSGTAAAPITLKGDPMGPSDVIGGSYDLRVTGASNIVISDMQFDSATTSAVLIDGSHDVTYSSNHMNYGLGGFANGTQVHVTDGSTNIDLADNLIEASYTSAIVIDGGGSGDIVTTNLIDWTDGSGISVDSVSGTDIVSNTIDGSCGPGIALTGTATGATVENNAVAQVHPTGTSLTCATATTQPSGIEVDAGSASGTTENYNDVDTGSASVADYEWSGTYYATAATLNAATGQAATDSNALAVEAGEPVAGSPVVDSADASAPGEQSTDVSGYARVDDPKVANTGIGAESYYDRGALELQDPLSFGLGFPQIEGPTGIGTRQAPAGSPVTIVSQATSGWGGTVSYSYDFGDGTPLVTSATGTVTHTFATAGDYQLHIGITSSFGGQSGLDYGAVHIVPAAAPAPTLTAVAIGDTSVSVDASKSTDPWGIYAVLFNFGDGSSTGSVSPSKAVTHTYARPGTYTITVTLQDPDQDNAQATTKFTTTAVTPALGTLGDVTGDGQPDLLAIDTAGNLWLYPDTGGTGTGTFGTRTQVGSGWAGYTLDAVARLSPTGNAGLLATDPTGDLYYYPNTGGTGLNTFGTPTQVGTGWTGMDVVGLTDLYATGSPGILTINTNDTNLYYYPNTGGTGLDTFAAPTQVGSGWTSALTAMVGTVTSTTRPDLLVLGTGGNLYLYPNAGGTGTNTFAAPSLVGTGLDGYRLTALTDPYSTGHNGYLTVNTADGNLYYTANNSGTGLSTFGTPTLVGTGWSSYTIN